MDSGYVFTVIMLAGVVTVALRALPFVAGRWLKRHPVVDQLGETLPLIIMALLLVDTVLGEMQGNPHGAWQEWLAVAVVVGLQWYTKQTLVSILVGTALYVGLRML